MVLAFFFARSTFLVLTFPLISYAQDQACLRFFFFHNTVQRTSEASFGAPPPFLRPLYFHSWTRFDLPDVFFPGEAFFFSLAGLPPPSFPPPKEEVDFSSILLSGDGGTPLFLPLGLPLIDLSFFLGGPYSILPPFSIDDKNL